VPFLILLAFSCKQRSNQPQDKLTAIHIDSIIKLNCDSLLNELKRIKADTFGRVTHTPIDFDACLLQLDTLINDRLKSWIKCLPDGEFGSFVHHGFGMYLRNNWGLWANSILSKNLYKMGILHPDDMTAIIFDSYQRRLKGETIRLQEQLKYYQDYWRKNGMPVDSILKTSEKNNHGG